MADLKLDPVTGDLELSTGDLQIVEGSDAIAQHIRIRLRTLLGEWFLDDRIGVPYIQRILIKNPGTNVVRRILRQVVEQTPGVVDVGAFTTDYDGATRRLSVSFNATVDGDATLEFQDELIVEI
jgi:hypothetical protein